MATGARYRKLPVPRLAEFEKTSIYYAATLMEAQLCTSEPVVVVGGGNSAGQAAVFLADHAGKLWLVVREQRLDQNMSRYLADRIEQDPRIEVMLHTEVRELLGDQVLKGVVVQDNHTGLLRTLQTAKVFVFIGADPCTEWVADTIALDSSGYVLTGADAAKAIHGDVEDLTPAPLMLETTAPGVFATGDARSGSVKRVASAVGEGAMAVRLVHNHLSSLRQ
ncbi:MAG: NAD(P)/FAD-dependent oxidoreductase [Pseudonocardiaceae bacterium]